MLKVLKKIKRIAAPDALIRVKGGDPRANRINPKILLKINKTGHNSYIIQALSTEVLKVKTFLRYAIPFFERSFPVLNQDC